MTEDPDRVGDHDETLAEATGQEDVDEVLRSLAQLGQRPVAEHVEVFEAAHERLRAALTDAGARADGSAG